MDSAFDPKQAVTFDLPTGGIQQGASRALLLPAAALAKLLEAAPGDAAHALGAEIGGALGARIRETVAIDTLSLDRAAGALATELALAGLGALVIERWGRALVVRLDATPFAGPNADRLLAAVIETSIAAATGRAPRVLPIGRDGENLRMFVGRPDSVERVAGWLREGIGWGDALVRLHAGEAAA